MLRSEVYITIKDCLLEKMPILKFVDLQKGQFTQAQENYPIPLPACLLKFGEVKWSNAESGTQLGCVNISAYLYVSLVTDSFNGAEGEEETLKLLNLQDVLFKAIQGIASENCSPLNCINDGEPQYTEGLVQFKSDFETVLYRTTQQQKQTVLPPTPKFKFR